MAETRTMIEIVHDNIMDDLCKKGFAGLVSKITHDYKNETAPTPYKPTSDIPTKTKNETPAGYYLRPAGSPSLLIMRCD